MVADQAAGEFPPIIQILTSLDADTSRIYPQARIAKPISCC